MSRAEEAAVLAALLDPNLETRLEIVGLIPGADFFTDPQMGIAFEAIRFLPASNRNILLINDGVRGDITGQLGIGPWDALSTAKTLHKQWQDRARRDAIGIANLRVLPIGDPIGVAIGAARKLVERLEKIESVGSDARADPDAEAWTRTNLILSGLESGATLMTATDAEPPASVLGNGLLPRGALAIIAAEGGSGKSWLMIRLAMAVARGEPWLGIPTTQGRACILSFELPRWALRQRLTTIAKDDHGSFDNILLLGRERLLGMKLPGDEHAIGSIIEALDLALLVIDPFGQIQATQGDTGEDVGPPITAMLKIATRTGCAIIAPHHVSKPAGAEKRAPIDMLRGHSRLRDDPDLVAVIENMGGLRRLTFPKPRFAEAPEPIWMTTLGVVVASPETAKKQASANATMVLEMLETNPGIAFTADEIGDALDLRSASGFPIKATTIRLKYLANLVALERVFEVVPERRNLPKRWKAVAPSIQSTEAVAAQPDPATAQRLMC